LVFYGQDGKEEAAEYTDLKTPCLVEQKYGLKLQIE
jgi:hypothetical protein